ncbi:YbaK/EbsC family protein [bacterium]|nr:YbaK/EbsC family protein [bacterium]
MAIPKKVLNYLKKNKIKFEIIPHRTVYTAYDLSQTLKVKPNIIGKTLLLKVDKNYALVITAANKNIDLKKFKKVFKVKQVKIIKENLIKKLLKIKPGTQTPFGNLYKLPVYLDKSLLKQKKIIISAGTYNDAIKIGVKSLVKLENPRIGSFSKKK